MIRHTVLFSWEPDATNEHKQRAATELAKLPSIIASVRAFASGPDAGWPQGTSTSRYQPASMTRPARRACSRPGRLRGSPKIAIAGPGHVGVTLAYACLIRGTGRTIALLGRYAGKVRAEVADLQHGLQFVPMATVAGSDDVEVCRDLRPPLLEVAPYLTS